MSTNNAVNITTQKVSLEAVYQALITGINTLLPGVDPFVLANESISRADLIQKLQSRIDAGNAVKPALLAYRAAIEKERAIDATISPLRAQLKVYLQARYGKSGSQLQSFGFTPNKVPNRPVASKAAGVANAKATRTARHTLGKKQKAGIHGTVATTAASPPSPAVAPTPAPAPITTPAGAVTAKAPAASTTGGGV